MAARRFGAKVLHAGERASLMVGQYGFDTTVTLNFYNRNRNTEALISLALVDSTDIRDLATEDWIFIEMPLGGCKEYVKKIVVEENHMLVIESSMESVSCVAYGYEEEKF